MSTDTKARLAVAVASAGGWLGGSLQAAEAAKELEPVAAAATSTPSIEGAKKEFDALKAAREAALRGQGTTLPRVAVPELQTGFGDLRPTRGTKTNPAIDPTKKSANWLVEAMAREPALRRDGERGRVSNPNNARDPREMGTREGGVEGALSDGTGAAVAASLNAPPSEAAATREARDAARPEREKSAEAPNPLNRYLAEWMTPRDYATLKPSLTDGLAADGAGRGGLGKIALPASMGGGLSGVTLPGGIAATPPGTEFVGSGPKISAPPPRENPFLQSFPVSPAPVTNLPATPPLPGPATGAPVVSPLLPSTPATPVAKPAVPDFARPAQDEKYFKQLKRF